MTPKPHPPVVCTDPITQSNLTRIRPADADEFETNEAAGLVAYDLLRLTLNDVPLSTKTITTPTAADVDMPTISPNFKVCIVYVMRAGAVFKGSVDLIRRSRIQVSEIYLEAKRNEETLQPILLGCKLPEVIEADLVIIVEPMCATGGSSKLAVDVIRGVFTGKIRAVHFFATQKGIDLMAKEHPDVTQICGVIDPRLNEEGYIDPGCGDFGNDTTRTIPAEE